LLVFFTNKATKYFALHQRLPRLTGDADVFY